MKTLVCVKRVPATGARIVLTEDQQEINTRNLGFVISPHEECGVEQAVQLKEAHGGEATVLTLGPEESVDQLRWALSLGIDKAVLLPTDGGDWDPIATADALIEAIKQIQEEDGAFDLMIFGNESADNGGYQVGIRVAHALGLPIVGGVKSLEIVAGKAIAKRQVGKGWEVYELPLPAVVTVKEGITWPRYPSLPGRMRAKKKPITRIEPTAKDGGLNKIRLLNPVESASEVEVLGEGPAAATKVVEKMKELGVI